MHFGEYELSPGLISLSPLPSAHPEAFQRLLVRPSKKLFNAYWCGPPSGVTRTSAWPRVDHPVSRPPPPTERHLRLAFAAAAGLKALNLAGEDDS